MPGRMLWIDTVMNLDVGSGAQGAQDLAVNFTSEQTRITQMTLMRTIIRLDLAYTVHDAGEGSQRLSIGFGIESQESFGAAIHPNPNNGSDFPVRGWIFRGVYRIFGFAADQPAVYNRAVDEDMRSRRKLENGVSFVVIDNDPLEGVAATVRTFGVVRQLWLVS